MAFNQISFSKSLLGNSLTYLYKHQHLNIPFSKSFLKFSFLQFYSFFVDRLQVSYFFYQLNLSCFEIPRDQWVSFIKACIEQVLNLCVSSTSILECWHLSQKRPKLQYMGNSFPLSVIFFFFFCFKQLRFESSDAVTVPHYCCLFFCCCVWKCNVLQLE